MGICSYHHFQFYGRYGVLSNITRSPSPECYTTFWMMTIYSDTLHWSGITLLFDPITDPDLITEFDFLPNCERFPWIICNGCGMPTEDAYSSGHLVLSYFGLASVLMLRPISHELVLFPDFWVSNIPRYFCFFFYSIRFKNGEWK